MSRFHSLAQRLGAAAIALTAIIAPLAGSAQDVPSYAQPGYASTDETIHGRIRTVDGAFNISVDDDRGFVDNVQLHQGTIINPTGLTLSPGMSVTILGVNAGSMLNANEIDTPYSYSGPLPTPVYYGPGYWCPGFAYGYGPSFSLAIIIGGGGRPWSYANHPFYGRPWDGHAYFGGYVGSGPEGQSRGRVENRTVSADPSRRAPTSLRTQAGRPDAHVPSAFAGRSFAGDSPIRSERFSSESTGRTPASTRTLPADSRSAYTRNAYPGEMQARGPATGGAYSRGSSAGGGAASRSFGGGAGSRSFGGGTAGRSFGGGAASRSSGGGAPSQSSRGGGGHGH